MRVARRWIQPHRRRGALPSSGDVDPGPLRRGQVQGAGTKQPKRVAETRAGSPPAIRPGSGRTARPIGSSCVNRPAGFVMRFDCMVSPRPPPTQEQTNVPNRRCEGLTAGRPDRRSPRAREKIHQRRRKSVSRAGGLTKTGRASWRTATPARQRPSTTPMVDTSPRACR